MGLHRGHQRRTGESEEVGDLAPALRAARCRLLVVECPHGWGMPMRHADAPPSLCGGVDLGWCYDLAPASGNPAAQ